MATSFVSGLSSNSQPTASSTSVQTSTVSVGVPESFSFSQTSSSLLPLSSEQTSLSQSPDQSQLSKSATTHDIPTTRQSQLPQPSQLANTGSRKTPGPHAAVIAGSTAGSVGLLLVVAAVFLGCRRQRQAEHVARDIPITTVVPESWPRSVNGPGIITEANESTDSRITAEGHVMRNLSSATDSAALTFTSEFDATAPLLAQGATPQRASVTPSAVMQHQDGGRLTELPPPYPSVTGNITDADDGTLRRLPLYLTMH